MHRIAHHAGIRPLRLRRTARNRGLVFTAAATALLLVPAVHRPATRLMWNASGSVPIGLYRIAPGDATPVGALVAVRPAPALESFMAMRRYIERNVPLLKPIAAAAGATVCRTGLRVTIEGRKAATALPRDRFGRPLPIWSGCRRLAPEELFLIASDSAASFDSRYFGPVTRSQVIGRAFPVWTWR